MFSFRTWADCRFTIGRRKNRLAAVIGMKIHHRVLKQTEKSVHFILLRKEYQSFTLYDCVSPEVQNSINETGRVTNG